MSLALWFMHCRKKELRSEERLTILAPDQKSYYNYLKFSQSICRQRPTVNDSTAVRRQAGHGIQPESFLQTDQLTSKLSESRGPASDLRSFRTRFGKAPAHDRLIDNRHASFSCEAGLTEIRVKASEVCRAALLGQPIRTRVNSIADAPPLLTPTVES